MVVWRFYQYCLEKVARRGHKTERRQNNLIHIFLLFFHKRKKKSNLSASALWEVKEEMVIKIDKALVVQHSVALNESKSLRLDGLHPWVLKKFADVISGPLLKSLRNY